MGVRIILVKIISALDENNLIGKDGGLPWYFKEDLKFFRKTTINSVVIMGFNTFKSIGKPLDLRYNYVIKKNCLHRYGDAFCNNLFYETDLNDAVEYLKNKDINNIFIIGGAKTYKQALDCDLVDEMIISRIHDVYTGDTFFPEIDYSKWKIYNTEKLSEIITIEYWKKK